MEYIIIGILGVLALLVSEPLCKWEHEWREEKRKNNKH